MATVTGFTAAHITALLNGTVVDARVDSGTGHLILIMRDSSEIDVGLVGGGGGGGATTMPTLTDVDDGGPVNIQDVPMWDGDSFAFTKTPTFEDKRFLDVPLVNALRQYRLATALRTVISTVDICIIGDSITEGYYQAVDAGTWPHYFRFLQQHLNAVATPRGGEGFIPARHTVTSPAMQARWALSAGVDVTANPLYGLGMRSAIIHPGDTATLSFIGTRLDVIYTQKPGAGTISVAIDGGSPVSVSTANATTKSGRLLSSASVTNLNNTVTHTAVVTATGADVVLDGGFVCNNDEIVGMRVWPGGHSGYTAVHFADPAKLWDDLLETVNMDLVIVFLGVNDFSTGQTASQLKTNLITIGQRIKDKSAVDPSILYVVPWPTQGTSAGTFAPFANAVREAARYHGAAVFDAWEALGTPTGSGIWYDTVHLNLYGSLGFSEAINRQIGGSEQDYPYNHAARHRSGGVDPLVYQARKQNIEATQSNALHADAELFLDLPGTTTFEIEALIYHDGPTATDIKLGWILPASAAGKITAQFSLISATAQFDPTEALQQVTSYFSVMSAATFAGIITVTFFRGHLYNPAPGRLSLTWAQNATTASDTRVLDGSYIKCTPV